ncbi:hypothetical protein OQA88_4570 [Cercophora sp. LCS_1]
MGSINTPILESGDINLPIVKLTTTLSSLYRHASPKPPPALLFTPLPSALPLSSSLPGNTKYLYQDTPFNTLPPASLTPTNKPLIKSLSMKYLSLIPQRDAFIAGPTAPVLLFTTNSSAKREAERTFSVLDPSQRPNVIFCSGPDDIPSHINKIAYKIALDGLEGRDLVVDLEKHWFLNSKVGLLESGLPTPRGVVVDVEGVLPTGGKCCGTCDEARGLFVEGCTGKRGEWVREQVERVVTEIKGREVPFVVKNQQTFGGAGTWVVRNQEEKEQTIQELRGALSKLFGMVTEENQPMRPGSVVICDMVRDPIGDYGVTFLVTEQGEAVWLAASEQMIDEDNAWVGSRIDYARQEMLQQNFEPLVRRAAQWVAKHGYYGPVGMDILETKTDGETESQAGEKTKYHIVDLNVRTSGSLALPMLREHFEERGLSCASSFSITVKGGRNKFIQRWKREFEEGRMLILSWYEDAEAGESMADVVIGGEVEEALSNKSGTFEPVAGKAQAQNLPGQGLLEKDTDPSSESTKLEGDAQTYEYAGANKLNGRKSLITGTTLVDACRNLPSSPAGPTCATSEIGRAVEVLFAREGSGVTIVYLPEEQTDAEKTERLVEKGGRKCLLVPGDLMDNATCKEAIVCGDFAETDLDNAESTFRSNILHMFAATKYALLHMKMGASIISSVINTTSTVGVRGTASLVGCAAAKGAIVSFTKALAESLLPKGIRVNAVALGPVDTPLQPASRPAEQMEEFGSKSQLGGPGQPSEIAPSFVFLAAQDLELYHGLVLHAYLLGG